MTVIDVGAPGSEVRGWTEPSRGYDLEIRRSTCFIMAGEREKHRVWVESGLRFCWQDDEETTF